MVEAAVLEKRLCIATIASSIVGMVILIVCISTDHWVKLSIPGGQWNNRTQSYIMSHYSGLWRICRHYKRNNTLPATHTTRCASLKFYPSSGEIVKDPEVDDEILDFSRSETAFAIMSLILAFIANVFAVYAVKQVRYMFKRLAAMLYLITAACIVVCLEVFQYSIEYEQKFLPKRHPNGSNIGYDWSFGLCWVVFIIYIIAPIVLFVTSRKRKGDKARTEQEAMENEPVILGRVG